MRIAEARISKSSRWRPRNGAAERPAIIRVEFHSHFDGQLGELREVPGRAHEMQTLDDPPIQFKEFVFGGLGEIEPHATQAA